MSFSRLILGISYFFLVSILVLASMDSVSQVKISTLKKRKKQNEKDIAYTNTLLEKTLKNKKVGLGQLNLLNQKIKVRQELIESIENEISYIGKQINQIDNEVNEFKDELEKLKKQYAKAIKYAYKQKDSYEKLMFLLSSKDFSQAYKRYRYLQQFSEYTRKQGETIAEKKDALNIKLDDLSKAKEEKEELLSQKTEEKSSLSLEEAQQSGLVKKLKKREKKLRADLKKQKKDAQKLEKEIQRVIERQARLAKLAAKKKSESEKYKLSLEEKLLSESFGKNKGKLSWPTKTGFISEKFGEHPHPVLKHVKVRSDGVSITTDAKSECRSIFKGEVTQILYMPGLNNVVIIRHGEYFSVYSNLLSVSVKNGDLVDRKQKIGVVYTDLTQGQAVLKFQLWKGINKLDPFDWLYHN